MPAPTASTFGRRGAFVELSEASSSVGQLEARAGRNLLWPPLPKRAWPGPPVLSSFRHDGGLGPFYAG